MLDLSGPKLRAALESLIGGAERHGGIEAFAAALQLKAKGFQDLLSDGRAHRLELSDFEQLASTMPTVRRRVHRLITEQSWAQLRSAISALLDAARDTTEADRAIAAFETRLAPPARQRSEPQPANNRFIRDLAAEILHFTFPETYPLMTRWMWDAKANTGVLREIWHGDDLDHTVIDAPDCHEAFLVLREELSQFLSANGIFRDVLWYVDLLGGHVYGQYVSAQGGAYLKADFASQGDPLEHTRRILGLDGERRSGRSRLKTIDGEAARLDDIKRIPQR